MKTALFALAAVAAAPVMAGTTYTVVEPTNPYSIELGVGYNFAARDVLRIDGVNESTKTHPSTCALVLPPGRMTRTTKISPSWMLASTISS